MRLYLNRLLNNKKFLIMVLIELLTVGVGYILRLHSSIPSFPFDYQRAAYEQVMFYDDSVGYLLCMLLIPFMISFLFADVFYFMNTGGLTKSIYLRTGKVKDSKERMKAAFITGVVLMAIPILFDTVLCLVSFPLNDHDNYLYNINYTMYDYFAYREIFSPGSFWNHAPYLIMILYMINCIFIGGLFGVIGLQVTELRLSNKALDMLGLSILLIGMTFIIGKLGGYWYSLDWMFYGQQVTSDFYLKFIIIDLMIILVIFVLGAVLKVRNKDELV